MLTGSHVTLRALEPADLPFLLRLENDPTLWDAGDTRVPYSRHALEQYIERAAVEDVWAVRQVRFVIGTGADGTRPAGVLDLYDLAPAHRRAAVGIALLPAARGQGLASEALALLCEYAAAALHLHQLYCAIATDNPASLRLFRAAGFTEIGLRREWLLGLHGRWLDVIEFQRLL
ncbi:MAG: GNAT family N-acetyltransferase [Hymenobacteraceae bacterium]|nr:GNAT family N-acetyltransferase [Hymenobacteraceae bacterium]